MGIPEQTSSKATPKRCHSCVIANRIMAHQAHRKQTNAMKHVVPATRIDTRLLRALPATKSGLVGKKRKLWTGFNRSTVFLEIKSAHALVFKSRVSNQAQADDAVPHKVYALRGATVAIDAHTRSSLSLFAFSITFANGKITSFSVKSAKEREEWTQAITIAAAGPCFNDWRKVARLGQGHFGKVFLSVHTQTGALVAMKQVDRAGGKQARMIHERAVVQRVTEIGSRFLSRTVAALREPTSGDLVYINELHTGGDLWGLIRQVKRLSDVDAIRFIASEVALGIQHLHDHGIMHRDIKLENIMLDSSGHLKLIDFGLSMCLKPVQITEDMMMAKSSLRGSAMAPMFQRTFSVCGTNYYMPPEMLTGGHGHGLSLDWWQLGCLVYELFVGRPAFYEVGAAKIHAKVLAGPPAFPPQDKIVIPQDAKDFILELLKHDSTMRLGSSGIESVQSHPFLQHMDWTEAEKGALPVPQVLVKHVSANTTKTSALDLSADAAVLLMQSQEAESNTPSESTESEATKLVASYSSSSDVEVLRKREFKRHSTQTPTSWHALDQLVSHFPDVTDVDGGKFSVIDGVHKLSRSIEARQSLEDDSASRNSTSTATGGVRKIKISRVSSCPSYQPLSSSPSTKPNRNVVLLPNDAYLGFDYLAQSDVLDACIAETKAIGMVSPTTSGGVDKHFSTSRVHSSASSVSASSSSHDVIVGTV